MWRAASRAKTRAAERQHDVFRQPPPDRSAERQRTQALRHSQINGPSPVDPFQLNRQQAVGPQQPVATNEFSDAAEVGKLEVVLRERIPQVAEADIASFDDAVEQLFHELVTRDPFRDVLRHETDAVEHVHDAGRTVSRSRVSIRPATCSSSRSRLCRASTSRRTVGMRLEAVRSDLATSTCCNSGSGRRSGSRPRERSQDHQPNR